MSWKRIIIIALIIAVIVLALGFLFTEGYIEPKWQTLTIILGALAIPYQFLKNKFSDFGNKYKEIETLANRAEARKSAEAVHRESTDQKIREQELRLKLLEERLRNLDTSIENIELKREKVTREVKNMDENELKDAFEKRFKRGK